MIQNQKLQDGCDPSKKALDKTEVSHKNFDIDANDQSKQGPEPEIGTENQKGPESEVTDVSDTSINVPGDNIGTDVISPGEGGSDDKRDGSTVLPSHPPLSGKALLYQQYLESKQKQKKRKRKKEKKKQKTVLPSNPPSQCLHHDILIMYLHHFPPNDLHLLKDIIQDIITTSTSPPKRCTITPIAKFDLEVTHGPPLARQPQQVLPLFLRTLLVKTDFPPSQLTK
jgi:hypothetical protein